MWNTVIFDLDGTLTESGTGIKRSVQYALSAFGLRITTEQELNKYIGPPLKVSFQKYVGMSPEDAQRAVEIFRERYNTVGVYENALYAGIGNLLAGLKCHGFRLAVASNKPDSLVKFVLQYFGIAQYFDVMVGTPENDETSGKAVRIGDALYRLGLKYTRHMTVYVGDRDEDVEAARLCGIDAIGASYGYGPKEELIRSNPAAIADSPDALLTILLNQAGIARRNVDYQAAWLNMQNQKSLSSVTAAYPSAQSLPVYTAFPNQPSYSAMPDRTSFRAPVDQSIPAAAPDLPVYMPIPGGNPAQAAFRPKEHIAKKIWRIIYPPLLYTGLSYGISIIAGIIIASLLLTNGSGIGAITEKLESDAVLLQGIAAAAAIPLCIFFFRRDERRRKSGLYPNDCVYPKEKLKIPRVVLFLIYTLAIAIVADIAISLSGIEELDSVYQSVEQSFFVKIPLIEQVLILGILGPIAEELVFRALVFRRLHDYMKLRWAVIISAAMFGLTHGNLVQGLFAGVLGIVLALIYVDTGRLIVPILGHMANNLFSVFTNQLGIPDGVYLILLIASALAACILTWYLFFEKRSSGLARERNAEKNKP